MRMLRFTSFVSLLASMMFVHSVSRVNAQFTVFDNFDALAFDSNINGQNGWNAPAGTVRKVVGDPIFAGNQVFEITGLGGAATQDDFVWKSLGANAIPDGDPASTLYTRLYVPVGTSPSITLSLRNGPVDYTGLGGTASGMATNVAVVSSGANFLLQSASGDPSGDGTQGGLATLQTTSAEAVLLEKGTWYDLWMVTNSATNTFNVYLQGGAFTTQTQLQLPGMPNINFRDFRTLPDNTSTANVALDYFYVRPNLSHSDGSILFDNMQLSNVQDLSKPALAAFAQPSLIVDRDTGSISLSNSGSAASSLAIQGYSITSASGALNSLASNWRSIAENYDSNTGQTVDADDEWTVLSARKNGNGDLSEFQFDGPPGNGGMVGIGQTVALSQPASSGVWLRTPTEDIVAQVTLTNGVTTTIPVVYIGNGGNPFKRSDFDLDGTVDIDDWNNFIANDLSNVSGLSTALAYTMGDINQDGSINIHDFVLFQSDYDTDNGQGSFAAMIAGVPEPSSFLILFSGIASICLLKRFSSLRFVSLGSFFLVLVMSSNVARADWTLIDDFEGTTLSGVNSDNTPVYFNAENTKTPHPAAPWEDPSDGGWVLKGNTTGAGTNSREWTIIQDPADASNQVLSVSGEYDTAMQKAIPGGGLAENAQGTFFFRYNYLTGGPSIGVSLTEAGSNGGAGSVGAYSQVNTSLNAFPAVDSSSLTAAAATTQSTWYNVWYQINNMPVSAAMDGTFELFIQGGTFATPTSVGMYRYRQNPIGPLAFVQLRPDNANNNDQVLFDDFAFMNGFSLEVPMIEPTIITALVHPTTGAVALANKSANVIEFNAYELTSPNNALKTADGQWNSLDDQNLDSIGPNPGQSWQQSGGSNAGVLGERFLLGASTLGAGEMISLGKAYDPGIGDTELALTYYSVQAGFLKNAAIEFVVPGDMDGNGTLQQADIDAFVLALSNRAAFDSTYGAVFPDIVGDFNGNGRLDLGDTGGFKAAILALPGSGSFDLSNIPEPSSVLLCLGSFITVLGCRRFRRSAKLQSIG